MSAVATSPDSSVHIRVEGKAGRVTLNRPKALNALDHEMVLAIDAALKAWADDPAVAIVVIDGAGEKAFCAGGDIAALYHAGVAGDFETGRRFWCDEYRLNRRIAHYAKPIVAILDGITMGGGVGLSAHASHRIATERSIVALPECVIGLVPDVGSSLVLARAPGELGVYLGLTGSRMNAADAIYAGFADYYAESGDLPAIVEKLAETGYPSVVPGMTGTPPASPLSDHQGRIDRLFAGDDVAAVCRMLAESDEPVAAEALAAIRKGSPLSVAATFAIVRAVAQDPTIETALAAEYRFTHRSQSEADHVEGVRAAIIDKDKAPVWPDRDLESLPKARLSSVLASLGEREWSPEDSVDRTVDRDAGA